eukprot:560799-Rhodomonas_salina.4
MEIKNIQDKEERKHQVSLSVHSLSLFPFLPPSSSLSLSLLSRSLFLLAHGGISRTDIRATLGRDYAAQDRERGPTLRYLPTLSPGELLYWHSLRRRPALEHRDNLRVVLRALGGVQCWNNLCLTYLVVVRY